MAAARHALMALASIFALTACVSPLSTTGAVRDRHRPAAAIPQWPNDDLVALPGSGGKAVPGTPGPVQ